MNRGKYSRRHGASLWREIVENANGCKSSVWLLRVSQALWFRVPQVSSQERNSQDFWFLEDPRQLFTCHLQTPPACFAGRVILVKDSFRALGNRCEHDPLVQPDSTGQILEKKKGNFFFFYYYYFLQAQSCHISSSSCEGILDRTSHLNNAKHHLHHRS